MCGSWWRWKPFRRQFTGRRHCYITTCCVIYVIALLTGLTSCIQSNVSHRRISYSASHRSSPVPSVLAAEAARTDDVAVSNRIGFILHALRCLLEVRRGVLEYSRRTALGTLIVTAVIPWSHYLTSGVARTKTTNEAVSLCELGTFHSLADNNFVHVLLLLSGRVKHWIIYIYIYIVTGNSLYHTPYLVKISQTAPDLHV